MLYLTLHLDVYWKQITGSISFFLIQDIKFSEICGGITCIVPSLEHLARRSITQMYYARIYTMEKLEDLLPKTLLDEGIPFRVSIKSLREDYLIGEFKLKLSQDMDLYTITKFFDLKSIIQKDLETTQCYEMKFGDPSRGCEYGIWLYKDDSQREWSVKFCCHIREKDDDDDEEEEEEEELEGPHSHSGLIKLWISGVQMIFGALPLEVSLDKIVYDVEICRPLLSTVFNARIWGESAIVWPVHASRCTDVNCRKVKLHLVGAAEVLLNIGQRLDMDIMTDVFNECPEMCGVRLYYF